MCLTFIGYSEAVHNTRTQYKCLFVFLQPNASGVCAEDGQGPSSKRGYGESNPGSERRDAIARTTLNNNLVKTNLEPNYKHSQIFNQEPETSLANYLEKCSGMFHG